MESNEVVKKKIRTLLSHYFGERVGISYYDGYGEETLPIYVHNAFQLLANQIGKDKSKEELNKILFTHSLSNLQYE